MCFCCVCFFFVLEKDSHKRRWEWDETTAVDMKDSDTLRPCAHLTQKTTHEQQRLNKRHNTATESSLMFDGLAVVLPSVAADTDLDVCTLAVLENDLDSVEGGPSIHSTSPDLDCR